jgi:uncharacterized protein (DUF1330 family)
LIFLGREIMSVHVIIDIKIIDRDMYMEYVSQVPPIVKKFGGRYIARGENITTLSGTWHPERMIILEFDNAEQVHDWFTSPEYAEVAHLRENATITNAVIIENNKLP